ncbi:MAG: DUF3054 domain-containing protein [Microthrixaceae bacterium]|nr:DUF3054 domain-containing protein [Microthrixaceae bacterium]
MALDLDLEPPASDRRTAVTPPMVAAAVADVVVVLAFVATGRNNHDEGLSVASVLDVATPFLVALALGWVATTALGNRLGGAPSGVPRVVRVWPTGVVLWVATAVGGLALRNVVFGDGTATSFVIVACAVLGVGLVGWRAAASAWFGRRG